MVLKAAEKEKTIILRKKGLSYREILVKVPVAKSTLSLWLRSVSLSKKQKQRLTDKKIAAALRGASRKRELRIKKTESIFRKAANDIKNISRHELFLIGVALYWAEGSKEKAEHPGSGVQFSNSDPAMVKLFLKWLTEICVVSKEKIDFDVYIHESRKNNIKQIIVFWSEYLEVSKKHFRHVYFKKNKVNTKRKNTGELYFGLLKVKVKASSNLNRKIAGWIKAINKYYWGMV